jgi:uncharacterized hydrophobic protein (TIGR00271 family)
MPNYVLLIMPYLAALKRFIAQKVQIKKEESFTDTYQEIVQGASFSGVNFWVLGLTMFIACIGLNIDSNSAIIGAMLISPLMGPTIGFAFAMAINDNYLKKKCLRNWLFMTLVSLTAATLFFLISPFDNNTVALESFKKASIFDILLALFGGAAGFIGIIKHDGSKVLAGVAVATACMPPLCTASFGIAHLDLNYTLGGLYFYLVNCLFIGVATFIAARFMGYHQISQLNGKAIKNTQKGLWALIIIIMFVPGVIIAYKKFIDNKKAIVTKTDKEKIKELEIRVNALDSLIKLKQH